MISPVVALTAKTSPLVWKNVKLSKTIQFNRFSPNFPALTPKGAQAVLDFSDSGLGTVISCCVFVILLTNVRLSNHRVKVLYR